MVETVCPRKLVPNAEPTRILKHMKLGQLKIALQKYPPDMDDMEVIIVTGVDGKKQHDMVCFTGYLPVPGHESVAIGGLTAVKVMVDSGEIQKPEGYDDLMT